MSTPAAPPATPPPFAVLLRALRQERAWSRVRLAQELGVSESTVEKWERGDAVPMMARARSPTSGTADQ